MYLQVTERVTDPKLIPHGKRTGDLVIIYKRQADHWTDAWKKLQEMLPGLDPGKHWVWLVDADKKGTERIVDDFEMVRHRFGKG